MCFHIAVPQGDGHTLLTMLQEQFGFLEVDWCVLQRPDYAQVDYGPCDANTSSGYTQDPFG